MKKSVIIGIIAIIVTVILIIAGVNLIGKNNKTTDGMPLISQKNNEVTYIDFSYEGISFKLPKEWNVKENADVLEGKFENENTYFSVMSQDVPSFAFRDFSEEYMPDMINNLPYTTYESCSSKEYSTYDAYDYNAKTIIKGQSTPVRATAISVNDKVIVFLLVTGDNNFNYEEIYDNILLSIK